MEENLLDIEKFFLIKKVYERFMNDRGLNSGFVIFAETLINHKFSYQQELSDYIGCNKAHTSRMVLKLQNNGLIEKDGLTLTKKGYEQAQKAVEQKRIFIEKLLENVDEQHLKTCLEVFDCIFQNAQNINKEEEA